MRMADSQNKKHSLGDHREVRKLLGSGGFSHVVSCYNFETCQMEAVKLISRRPRAMEYAKQEIETLKRLKAFDPDGCAFVRFYESFHYKGILCLSFEILDQDLKAYIDDFQDCSGLGGLPVREVRSILSQMLAALEVLFRSGVIHCDIKPENIMVVDRFHQPVTVKLVDFGAAQKSSEICRNDLIQTLWYSSPEVLIECPYNEAIDMWALGVTAAEAILGNPLYPETNNYNMIRSIIKTQGMIPDKLLEEGEQTEEYFCQEGHKTPSWRLKTAEEFNDDTGYHQDEDLDSFDSLDDILSVLEYQEQDGPNQELFVDLLKRMLHLDPQQRVTAKEALKHPFFSVQL